MGVYYGLAQSINANRRDQGRLADTGAPIDECVVYCRLTEGARRLETREPYREFSGDFAHSRRRRSFKLRARPASELPGKGFRGRMSCGDKEKLVLNNQ